MKEGSKDSTHQSPKVKVTPGIALAFVMLTYVFLNDLLIAQNDIFLGLLTLVNVALLTWIIFSIRKGIRAVVKANFVEGSLPYRWFNRNGVIQIVIALLASLTFAVAFVVILKSLTLRHSFLVIAIAIFISGWITGLFRSKSIERANGEGTFKDKESQAAVSNIFSIFVSVIVFTVVLAAATTAKDTHVFFINNAEFGNFSEIAYESSIDANGNNDVGRALVNLSLILEAFRQATVNEFFIALGLEKDSAKYFWFFSFIFVFNFFKLASFSAAFVLITVSARDHVLDKTVSLLSNSLGFLTVKLVWLKNSVTKNTNSSSKQGPDTKGDK